MNIIGIQWGDSSTSCLLSDDKIKAASAEERFTRLKNDMSFPKHSLKECFSEISNNGKLDYVALASNEFDYLTTLTQFYSLSY
jgi:carbamoyltransferase